MNRGSGGSNTIEASRPEDFNEAPIHESGKYQQAVVGESG